MEPEMRSEGLLRTTNQMFEFKASDILYKVWKEGPAPLLPQYKSHNPNFCHLYCEYHGGLGFSFSNKGSISRGTLLNTITFIQVLLGTVNFLQQDVNFWQNMQQYDMGYIIYTIKKPGPVLSSLPHPSCLKAGQSLTG